MKATVKIDLDRVIGSVNPNVYGQFMCRRPGCSEGGLYCPESPTADEFGLRKPVVAAIQDLKPPIIRWPGGCTGTSYHWIDGVGPLADRPRKIDLHFGWEARYEFGTDEFIAFCRRLGAEPQLNFAMGTGTLEEAAAWLEYCNGTTNTYYANLRRKYGHEQPYNVKYWQLGNENYGMWELNHKKPADYGEEAREWAKILRRCDPSIKLVAVGGHDIVPQWAWEVVPEVAPFVDYIAFHTYWSSEGNPDAYHKVLAGPHKAAAAMDFISSVIKLNYRKNARSRKLGIAVTEWNASPEGTMMASHPVFNPFLPTYHLYDALAVACFLNLMQQRCNEVTLANVAQSINVVGLIMVNGEDVWIEPVYWPLWMQVHYSGSQVIDSWVESPTFDEPGQVHPTREERFAAIPRMAENIPYLNCATTLDPDQRKLYLSLVNMHKDEEMVVSVALPEASIKAEGTLVELFHSDPNAKNSPSAPETIKPTISPIQGLSSRFTLALKPHSYTILALDLK